MVVPKIIAWGNPIFSVLQILEEKPGYTKTKKWLYREKLPVYGQVLQL